MKELNEKTEFWIDYFSDPMTIELLIQYLGRIKNIPMKFKGFVTEEDRRTMKQEELNDLLDRKQAIEKKIEELTKSL